MTKRKGLQRVSIVFDDELHYLRIHFDPPIPGLTSSPVDRAISRLVRSIRASRKREDVQRRKALAEADRAAARWED